MIPVLAIESQLKTLKNELNNELGCILNYWIKNTIDTEHGGFFGRIDAENNVIPDSPKGSVLNARILWSFSAAYDLTRDPEYLQYAHRAWQYIAAHFIDREYGGVYWTADYTGKPLDTKKQVYANAFTIYGLSEYFKASGDIAAKTEAVELYKLLVERCYDSKETGYLEAFTRNWRTIDDLRLSDKDANEKKTMNTHLHVLEAYVNLYSIWPGEELKAQIITLLHNFFDHFINKDTWHLNLFFDEDWNSRSELVSYGHDIEATWLLQQAAEVIGHETLLNRIKDVNVAITQATVIGLDNDGGLWYEYEPTHDNLIKEKHWWVQAEAMVGFFNGWQATGNDKYLALTEHNWAFIKNKIIDKQNGEWFWGINKEGELMQGEDKAGMWKCPYHNSRACIEIIKRISRETL